MRRYIDADKLKEMINRQYSYCHGYTGKKKDIYREALLTVKSAIHCQSVSKDMQKVVYCEDCKFYELAEYDEGTKNVCRLLKRQMQENDFCSYGERRDEE